MSSGLEGKVAIVTGAATGIGKAIATELAADGGRVVVNHLHTPDLADAVVATITSSGGEAIAAAADVGKRADYSALVPFELFGIMHEIAAARTDPATAETANGIAFMIDQSHNIEGKIDAMIQSVVNIQTAYAKALLIDDDQLRPAQEEGDVLGAHRVLLDAFATDVRPLLARLASERNLDTDPVEAFRLGGYAEQRARERGTAAVSSTYGS